LTQTSRSSESDMTSETRKPLDVDQQRDDSVTANNKICVRPQDLSTIQVSPEQRRVGDGHRLVVLSAKLRTLRCFPSLHCHDRDDAVEQAESNFLVAEKGRKDLRRSSSANISPPAIPERAPIEKRSSSRGRAGNQVVRLSELPDAAFFSRTTTMEAHAALGSGTILRPLSPPRPHTPPFLSNSAPQLSSPSLSPGPANFRQGSTGRRYPGNSSLDSQSRMSPTTPRPRGVTMEHWETFHRRHQSSAAR
jgi:hypothetical protein